jgi:hypothetical protein
MLLPFVRQRCRQFFAHGICRIRIMLIRYFIGDLLGALNGRVRQVVSRRARRIDES